MKNKNIKLLIAAFSLVIVFSANRVLADEIEENKANVESEEEAIQAEVAEKNENDIEDIAAVIEELEKKEAEGETKSFVPADFEEEYDVRIENIDEEISAFELGDNCNKLHLDNSSFKMTNTTSVSLGIVYDYSTSLYGVLKENPSSTIVAEGDKATYKTKSNERGEFLFTNIDYSKGFFGMCFEISIEG